MTTEAKIRALIRARDFLMDNYLVPIEERLEINKTLADLINRLSRETYGGKVDGQQTN